MEIQVERMGSKGFTGDTLVLAIGTDGLVGVEAWPGIPHALLDSLWQRGKISGKAEEIKIVYCSPPAKWQQVLLLGLGDKASGNSEAARLSGAALARELLHSQARKVVLAADLEEKVAVGLLQGLILGGYSFDSYKQQAKGRANIRVTFVSKPEQFAVLKRAIDMALIELKSVLYVRDLVNEPGNVLTPVRLAQEAQKIAAKYALDCECLGLPEIQQLKMEGLAGVARGSVEEPRLIVLRYTGNHATKQCLGLIGKGLTFDAGGISLKTVEGLRGEKSDMAGGATVLGTIAAIAELKMPVNVVGIIPATENLPSGSALKPDDILTMLDGTTVEIISTDSEGRLILADAIAYARRLNLSPIVDIATLTGHCSIALGPFYAGLWSNNNNLQEQILQAAQTSGERIWPMPYDGEFLELTKGVFADLKNSGGREGGACSAAAFLGHFAGESPWAHLDIAPTAFADNARGYIKRGGTGFGVRTLIEFARILENS